MDGKINGAEFYGTDTVDCEAKIYRSSECSDRVNIDSKFFKVSLHNGLWIYGGSDSMYFLGSSFSGTVVRGFTRLK